MQRINTAAPGTYAVELVQGNTRLAVERVVVKP